MSEHLKAYEPLPEEEFQAAENERSRSMAWRMRASRLLCLFVASYISASIFFEFIL